MADLSADETVRLAMRLEEACAKVLAGHPPDAQGAAIASLLGTWIAGHQERRVWPALARNALESALRIAEYESQRLALAGGLNG